MAPPRDVDPSHEVLGNTVPKGILAARTRTAADPPVPSALPIEFPSNQDITVGSFHSDLNPPPTSLPAQSPSINPPLPSDTTESRDPF